ncbi:TetR/AcrR family transcriptional regulator [Nocardioides campestrisoli]|uniref:TetR/AcrR family transcriptional regulator n=1 Tax=Nocardioides campestrisoli TaxID=2736757 RepID=UPI00163D989D|nr:TetR/AcrR family transcriptional regulator [Nocardioides campestrisoli]
MDRDASLSGRPRPSSPRRRTARQQDLLRRLVDLLAAEGFSQFTVDDLAERLRCSKTTLYALAPSKQELVLEAVREYFRASVPVVEARVEQAGDPGERVTAYLLAVADYLRPLSREFLTDLLASRATADVYSTNTAAAAARIRTLIAEGIEAGSFRAVNAEFVAEVVAATMEAIQRGELFARMEMTDAEAYAELASLVVHALAVGRD